MVDLTKDRDACPYCGKVLDVGIEHHECSGTEPDFIFTGPPEIAEQVKPGYLVELFVDGQSSYFVVTGVSGSTITAKKAKHAGRDVKFTFDGIEKSNESPVIPDSDNSSDIDIF